MRLVVCAYEFLILTGTMRRGAVVKAMAICTRHPFIQIFKPVLLMALDDYFSDPSQEWLARLFDAVNAMDISQAPVLSRDEKLVMRVSERKDVFIEKFHDAIAGSKRPSQENTTLHTSYASSNRDTLVNHYTENGSSTSFDGGKARSRTDSINSHDNTSEASSLQGSTAWNGDDATQESDSGAHNAGQSHHGRRSVDTTSVSSHGMHNGREASIPAILEPYSRGPKDTHFYSTSIVYRGHTLPIKMPLSTFPEEVGDVSIHELLSLPSC